MIRLDTLTRTMVFLTKRYKPLAFRAYWAVHRDKKAAHFHSLFICTLRTQRYVKVHTWWESLTSCVQSHNGLLAFHWSYTILSQCTTVVLVLWCCKLSLDRALCIICSLLFPYSIFSPTLSFTVLLLVLLFHIILLCWPCRSTCSLKPTNWARMSSAMMVL